ncbi:probable cytochrome P450 6a14 [Drosophila sulfurigaster albostrigata]|uniref:probable cytochrome P450 6a14 n=1 Tax=Drosophila sulfurigaster albostrigata TaxID=89887 RepID=UPI002D21D1EE|nr:probable cytochrome P450 6a14 [Drosophila sulfurigaster albostrigata]
MGFAIIVLSLLLIFVLSYLRQCYTYWEQRGIPQLRPNFLYGHFFKLNAVHLNDLIQETYDAFKGKYKVAGTYIFTRPIAIVTDLDLIKSILIKDFRNFVNRSDHPAPENVDRNPLLGNLFNLYDEKWRALRAKLTPTFTSGKIKSMFNTISDVSQQLEDTFQTEVESGGILDVYDLLGRYTVDVIGSCAFGIECNSLKDPQADFRVMGRKLFTETEKNIRWILFKLNYVKLLAKIPFRSFSDDNIGFYVNIVRQTVEHRERVNIRRNDFMDLLIDLRKSEDCQGLSVEQLAAQVFVFFIAGFETSSSNMSYALFELAKNEESQCKLRSEIQSVLQKHGKLTYDAMMEMTYLDQVINETLRKYPGLVSLTRMAAENYKFSSNDKEIVLKRGTKVYIPVNAIHNDPEIYPEPHKFMPERFAPEACQQRHPMAFLGFGDGPRNCIGMRFARMQVKMGLITLLNRFQFSPAPGEPTEVEIINHDIVRRPQNGVKLFVKRVES